MTFNDVIKDITKLIGLNLESVKPGSGIRILSIDEEQGNLQLRTAAGRVRSRPLLELKRIWDELQKSPAVHVDKVLNGSGTSRNQPETILANLPYIEWAKIHNKKHLIFVKESTHPYGTLRQMDRADAAKLSAMMDNYQGVEEVKVVVVTDDIKSSIEYFQGVCGGGVTAKEQGVYLLQSNTDLIAFTTPAHSGLSIGAYPVFEANYSIHNADSIHLLGETLFLAFSNEIGILLRQK